MKTSLLVLGACVVLVGVARAATDPADELRPILRDFLQEANYSWVTPSSRGMPEEPGTMLGEDAEGQHERNGYTRIAFKSGPHFQDGWSPGRPRLGFTDESTFWSSHWVYEMRDGWARLSDLKLPTSLPSRSAPARPGSVKLGGGRIGITKTLRWAGAWRPDLEIAIIVENLAGVEKVRKDVFEVELTPNGAGMLALYPYSPLPLMPVHTENATGSVTIQVRQGAIAAYDLNLEAVVVMLQSRIKRVISRRRILSDIGTTIIEIPAEVEKALGH
ncbi:MAG: hypothetical protein ABIO94_08730 [Opitutaceae bacterium]